MRVIVTAGANGIGLAIARAFAGEGARVHVCDVDQAALAALTASDPAITQTHCDVADRPPVQRLFDEATAKLGGLDVLVNNAGIAGPTAKVEEMHPDDWDRCLNICLTGQFNCTRLAVPLLRQSSNGSIVNLLLGGWPRRLRDALALCRSAKWGVIGFTKSLSIELGPDNIRVNAILPGLVAGAIASAACWKPRRSSAAFPLRRWRKPRSPIRQSRTTLTPEQIADQILFRPARADARSRARLFRSAATPKCWASRRCSRLEQANSTTLQSSPQGAKAGLSSTD